MTDEQPTIPSLPIYATTHHFIEKKQQAPLMKLMGKMMSKRLHPRKGMLSPKQNVRIKHKKKVIFY